MTIGYIGLGKMGRNMVLRLLGQKIGVVAWNRSPGPVEEVVKAGATGAQSVGELVQKLQTPRIIWLMLPAGDVVDEYVNILLPLLSKGDTIVDGGNSFYKDSVRRGEICQAAGIDYLDVGVSGGPDGAQNGACMMAGGSRDVYDRVLPVITAACAPEAYGYVGPSGAGHFVKMVHNGIEYGMMEAIAEGAAVLKKSPFGIDPAEVFRIYNHRSVIESRLTGWTEESLREDAELSGVTSEIAHTGEGDWTVATAKELGVGTPVISAALDVRKESSHSTDVYRNKVVSALRGKFGHHKVSKD